MPRVFGNAFAFALLLLVVAVAKPAFAETRTVTDAHGRQVEVTRADRIVSIGGAITEILFALGLGERVVGVDTTSSYPAEAQDRPRVGYMRALSAEGVLSLAPDLVIAVEGSGPPDVIDVLERASVPFVLVPEAHDGSSAAAKIRFIAGLLGVEEKGDALAAALESDLAALATWRSEIGERRKAVFVLGMSSGTALAAGSKTAADGIFSLAAVDNALSGFSGYKPASDEAVMGSAPDAIVIMAERSHELTAEKVFSVPAFADTPAASNGRLVALSGGYLLNFGPRTAHAARDLAAAIYPDRASPDLPRRPWAETAPSPAH